jgi:hypothetical protein
MRPRATSVAVVLAALVLPAIAVADPDVSAAAQKRMDDGLAAFQRGEYGAASDAFELAYEIDKTLPNILYSWATSERLGGRCTHAIILYTRYRGEKITPAQDAAAADGIARCERTQVTTEPPPSPPPREIVPPPPPRGLLRHPDDELIALGGIGLITGGALFLAARSDDATARSAMNLDTFHAAYDSSHRARLEGGIALGAGAGLAVLGFVLRVHHHRVEAATDGRTVMVGGEL